MRSERPWLSRLSTVSRGDGEGDVKRIGNSFSVIKALGEHAQRESLRSSDNLVPILTVGEDAGKLLDLRDPAAVAFPVQLNRQAHKLLILAEYSVVFGYSECLAGAGAARCAPTLYFANINKSTREPRFAIARLKPEVNQFQVELGL